MTQEHPADRVIALIDDATLDFSVSHDAMRSGASAAPEPPSATPLTDLESRTRAEALLHAKLGKIVRDVCDALTAFVRSCQRRGLLLAALARRAFNAKRRRARRAERRRLALMLRRQRRAGPLLARAAPRGG